MEEFNEASWNAAQEDFLALPETIFSKAQREKGVRLALSQAAWNVGQHLPTQGDLSLQDRFYRVAIETLRYLEENPKLVQETPEWKSL